MYTRLKTFLITATHTALSRYSCRKMSPNRVFDRSFDVLRKDPEIIRRYGDSIKAYGRDHGGKREGRRNFVEHSEYSDPVDGSKRTRVRYNLESRLGAAFVFAEVSNQMPGGEFVYVLVQDKSNGRVHTVVDNRAGLTAKRLASGSKEAQSAMMELLGGGKK
jgi:import inner membrane translocase subunit TIM21